MSILRDIFRRRLRSTLTICGIAVGVFALVVLGALAEKADMTLKNGADYYADKVVVVEKRATATTMFSLNTNSNRPLSQAKIAELEAYPGVRDVAPQVLLTLDEQALPVGTPSSILGGFVGTDSYREPWKAGKGRMLAESERGVAVVGANLAKALDAEVGGRVDVRGEDFEVVGITAPSNTPLDQAVIVPLADAQRLLVKTLPPAFARSVEASTLVLQATVYVKPGVDANELGTLLNRDVSGIKATGPAGLRRQLGSNVAMYSGLLMSVAAVALLVGSLSVVNTMTMTVSERKREVGLKRALGASRWRVGRDVLAESVVLGALGGLLGLGVGTAVVGVVNAASGLGTALFVVTARLAFCAIAFAGALGGLAGLYPAWRTARTDPVAQLALR